jgi:hypothetical protein
MASPDTRAAAASEIRTIDMTHVPKKLYSLIMLQAIFDIASDGYDDKNPLRIDGES